MAFSKINKMEAKVDFSLFSKYRTTLMGIAIFEVMLGHTVNWVGISFVNPVLNFAFSRFFSMIHTPGFLLLSGLGLYYSFAKNSNLKLFYLRRIQRMWLPFMMMAIPLYAYSFYQKGAFDMLEYLGLVTSLGYWFGDTNMWYIALSIALYAIFPFYYNWMERNWTEKTVITSILSIIICWMISYAYPIYFNKVYLALPKIPIFFLGIYIGYLAVKKKEIAVYKYIAMFLCLAVLLFIFSRSDSFYMYYCDLALFPITIWIVCMIYDKLRNYYLIKILLTIWNWLGKYTLELYVLHLLFYGIIKPENNIYYILMVFALAFAFCMPVQYLSQYISKIIIKL